MKPTVNVVGNIVHGSQLNPNHIYSVKVDRNTQVFTITNNKTKREETHKASEFTIHGADWNDRTKKYPNYVKMQVWTMHDFLFKLRVQEKRESK